MVEEANDQKWSYSKQGRGKSEGYWTEREGERAAGVARDSSNSTGSTRDM